MANRNTSCRTSRRCSSLSFTRRHLHIAADDSPRSQKIVGTGWRWNRQFRMTERPTRIEKDSMGEMSLPANALHGASTHRAVLNFPVSGYRFSRAFIRALGLIKEAAAQANHDLGLLDAERAALISQAAEEVAEGKLDDHFPLDIFQTGSGTSTNTNANEVIANRSAQLAGKPIGSREHVHPNDHVNMGQSSNDVIPSAIHISAAEELKNRLIPALQKLH